MGKPDRSDDAGRLPPPCAGCGERLGVWEPIVVAHLSGPTSWLRLDPDARRAVIRAWHPNCRLDGIGDPAPETGNA